jgi:DNA-binding NarL/FixJ family response regulator
MSISAVIVDDEQLARDELAYLLKEVDVDVIGPVSTGSESSRSCLIAKYRCRKSCSLQRSISTP